MTENPKEWDIIGTVHVVKPVETTGRFSRRRLVLRLDRERDAYVELEATYERIGELDSLHVGDQIHARFVVGGREWQDKRTNELKYFNSLSLTRFKVLRRAQVMAPKGASFDDEEVPF